MPPNLRHKFRRPADISMGSAAIQILMGIGTATKNGEVDGA
jgi:hypothetical protein